MSDHPTAPDLALDPPTADAAAGPARADALPILILGGGPVGMTCALLLARRGLPSVLVDARPIAALQRDRRLLSLSRGTLDALEPILGERFAPLGDIATIHVSSQGDWGTVRLGAADFAGRAVGATVWYADLVGALGRAVEAEPSIRVLRPRRALHVRQQTSQVLVELDDASQLRGSLAVDAEGSPPPQRPATEYALLAEVDIDTQPGLAIERFTPAGPLALLPLPTQALAAGPAAGERSLRSMRMAMVWCLAEERARALAAMDAAALCAQIAAALGGRQRAVDKLGPRTLFALITHKRQRICEHRLVHVGNAAQSLHPVAGQGFNLGMRDCVCLADSLAQFPLDAAGARPDAAVAPSWGAATPGGDPLQALQHYAASRRLDRTVLPLLTAALPWVFASRLPPLVLARSVALLGLERLRPLRRSFSRLLMYGVAGI